MSKLKLIFALVIVFTALWAVSCGECRHPNETTEVIKPTCVVGGATVHTCNDCGKVYETDQVPPLGHSFLETVTAANCTEEGFTTYKCSCGLEYTADVEPPLGHKLVDLMKLADCESQGSITHVCSVCEFSYTDSVTAPLGHSFVTEKVSPTCTSKGYTKYSCRCGFSYISDVVSPTEHSFATSIVVPDCVDEGYTEYSCACGFKYMNDFVAPVGHSLQATKVEPNCIESGYTEYVCECGYSFVSDPIAPLGHKYSTSLTSPTCIESGYTTYSCDCGYSYISDRIPPIGHNYTVDVTLPSCTEVGYTTYECKCSYSYVSDIKPPLGHDFVGETVYPTVMDFGYTSYVCKCGFSYVGDYVFYNEFFSGAYAGNDKVIARGIDVSRYNHPVAKDGSFLPIDWQAIKNAGIDYVIIKAGSTLRNGGILGGIEPTFEDDYAAAKAAGLDVGVYFFTYATDVNGMIADAKMLLNWLEDKQFEYPIYLDVEDVPREGYYPSQIPSPVLTEMCLNFFSILQKEGYYTGLYVNNEFLFNIMQTEHMIDMFEIWYARYPSGDEYVWDVGKYGEHLGMWQYSDSGRFDDIPDMTFDLNYSYKDYPSIIKMYGFNGFTSN